MGSVGIGVPINILLWERRSHKHFGTSWELRYHEVAYLMRSVPTEKWQLSGLAIFNIETVNLINIMI